LTVKWIILSKDRPAQLHAALASIACHRQYNKPCVLVDLIGNDPSTDSAYSLVSRRFRAIEFCGALSPEEWRDDLLELTSKPKHDGSIDQTIAITTDTMVLHERGDLYKPWRILLNDQSIAGVSLVGAFPSVELRESVGNTMMWDHDGKVFHFGVMYRTSDLLGTMFRTEWYTPDELVDAINSDIVLTRRPRLSAPPAALFDCKIPCHDATKRYLVNEIIDHKALPADHYTWTIWRNRKED